MKREIVLPAANQRGSQERNSSLFVVLFLFYFILFFFFNSFLVAYPALSSAPPERFFCDQNQVVRTGFGFYH